MSQPDSESAHSGPAPGNQVSPVQSAFVERDFWSKLGRLAARLPFSGDLLTAYYTATDPQTPSRVRVTLLAALAYFVIPADLIPDFIAGLGYTDDAAVLAAAIRTLSGHIRSQHRTLARDTLDQLRKD